MTNSTVIQKHDAAIERQEFGARQVQTTAETAATSVATREQAKIQAAYIMAERHPRSWDTVRLRLVEHCKRFGFAEVARYKKPTGKAQINGQWKEVFAEGLSARFAEVARQEMGNVSAETSVVFEDDMCRIIRASVVDIERNSHEAREVIIAKATEKRGKKDKTTGEWGPPEGREVISARINSYGDPVYLVRATDDETRIKQNSEISKLQRDATLRLIPKDIRDDCESQILASLADPKKVDPITQRKKILDAFAGVGVMPEDLMTYMSGESIDKLAPAQLDELRGLFQAIRDGETTFSQALKVKYDAPSGDESDADRDIRLEKQMKQQAKKPAEVAQERIAKEKGKRAKPEAEAAPPVELPVETAGGSTEIHELDFEGEIYRVPKAEWKKFLADCEKKGIAYEKAQYQYLVFKGRIAPPEPEQPAVEAQPTDDEMFNFGKGGR